jgi:putative transposase
MARTKTMRRSRFSESDILRILHEQKAGRSINELARKHGLSERTLYRWKARWGGVRVLATEELRQLVDENYRLRELLAEHKIVSSRPERKHKGK